MSDILIGVSDKKVNKTFLERWKVIEHDLNYISRVTHTALRRTDYLKFGWEKDWLHGGGTPAIEQSFALKRAHT